MVAEYIEREATCKDCFHCDACVRILKASFPNTTDEEIENVVSRNNGCPFFISKADVEVVRHGKWYKGDMPTYGGYKCSVCELNTVEYNKPYCPNCGADMRGEKK